MASAKAAGSCACRSRRPVTMSPAGTPTRSRIRAKSICPGRVRVPSMSKTTPRRPRGSSKLHRTETAGLSMDRLQSMILSSGGTRFSPTMRAEPRETVLRKTACSTAPAFSSASGASCGCICVHARSMAAVRSPVPVKGPPSIKGTRNNHLRLPASESSSATRWPPSVASGTSSVVMTTVLGPMWCSTSQARVASSRLPMVEPTRSSASNWLGVRIVTCGSTSSL
mmetsp:Transcript_102300/g.318657  ORF Transcript_102300/g.318657 Transcript_102300/m.318657 type:complete len:225 (-) Transcript_102300:467-1141(-)